MLNRQIVYKNKYFTIIGTEINSPQEQYFVNIKTYNKGEKCIYSDTTIEKCKEFIRNIDFDKYYF